MSQSEINSEIDQYLHLVRKKLSMLPDAEAIVSELRTHIWESANKFSTRDNMPIDQAFKKALDQMEDPEILANRFYEESGYEYSTPETPSTTSPSSSTSYNSPYSSFNQRSVVPERKLEQDRFFFIALIGFISSMIIGGTLVATIHDPVISVLGSLIQMAAFALFIAYLYFRDDQTFKEQIAILREKFEKSYSSRQEERMAKRSLRHERRRIRKELRNRKATPIEAFFIHLGAVIGAFFMFAVILLLAYVSFINVQPFFNDNWYYIGFVGFTIMIGSQMIYYVIKAFLGEVRGLRMLESLLNFTSAMIVFVLIFYYPFTIGSGIIQVSGSQLTDPKVISFLQNQIDYYIRIFMGISIVINLMKGIYGIFKFETWKEKDTKSLLNV